ncbi:unnamed protein product [Phyllotreta striolata]|uniref:Alanine--tRNA ligase n=1 Tax=Phyllotreta striolata TaxID=444603 RepID=A0A9N9TPH4_PHYSR|nr:unnamed protein product [Phyllotreta striolata]
MFHLSRIAHLLKSLPVIVRSNRRLSKCHSEFSSKVVRKKFLDYFVQEHNHKHVKSSPVVPYCDPTINFVNAGMNQFKGILIGTQQPKYRTVANSQKCIRVGGKHNDLSVVGSDGYHHTFFEMLGNWSFGEYFKAEACKLAWDLLTNVFKLPKNRLYVTYFKGDHELDLKEDVETKEIWRNLGLSNDRILPFGVKDNFWEMGLAGPCGPCTEIHYDHIGGADRAKYLNKGLHDLIEIWNVVFIEYNRLPDGTIHKLPRKHVDTGMGLERLTAVLQNKISNYDTDIFRYLFEAIYKNCRGVRRYGGSFGEKDWNDLDKSYRTMADHVRMITVSLADGMIPEENQKLRKIMRKTFLLGDNVFKQPKNFVKELTNYVVDNLGPVYPELERNISQVHRIVSYEEEVFESLRRSASKDWEILAKSNPKLSRLDIVETPNFVKAYKEVGENMPKEIHPKLAFKLYDTHGLDEETIAKLAEALNLRFNPDDLIDELQSVKIKSKRASVRVENGLYSTLFNDGIPKTDDRSKYSYSRSIDGKYKFDGIRTKVLKILRNDERLSEIESDHYCSLILDRTNLYSEAGGQTSDRGLIEFPEGVFEVTSLENLNGYILHNGFYKSKTEKLQCNIEGILKVDDGFRLNCMRNHTGIHLLNAVLKKQKSVTCQKSSRATDKYLNFDVAIFGDKLSKRDLVDVEKGVLEIVKKSEPVSIRSIDSQELLAYNELTLIPGEIYPDTGIRIVEIRSGDFLSREPCCGTHVANTADVEDFCLVNVKSLGRSTASVTAVTGEVARQARKNGALLLEQIEALSKKIDDNIDKREVLNMAVGALKKKLTNNFDESYVLPLNVKIECSEKLDSIMKKIQNVETECLKDFVVMEMQSALESNIRTTKSNRKYLIHYLRSSTMLDNVPLQKATKLCPDLPILVIAYVDNTVKARCCVPKDVKTDSFTAEKWMNEIASVFNSRAAPPKGQDGGLVCNMKAKRVHVQDLDPLLKDGMQKAQKYIEENL